MLLVLFCVCWLAGLGLSRHEQQRVESTSAYHFRSDRLDLQRLAPRLSTADAPSFLATLGLFCVLVSATPVLLHFQDAAVLYGVLLSYTLGLFGLALLTRRSLPWIGTVFMLLGLGLLPLNYLGLNSLELDRLSHLATACASTLILVWATRWMLHSFGFQALKLYSTGLSLLGVLAAFSRHYESVLVQQGGSRSEFESVLLLLPFLLVLPLAFELQQASLHKRLELWQMWGLQFLLLLFYLSIPVVNNLSPSHFAIVLALMGVLSAALSLQVAWQADPHSKRGRPMELQAFLFFSCATAASYFYPESLGWVALCAFPCFWLLSWFHWQHWRQWAYQALAALYLLLGAHFLMLSSELGRDQQSFGCALLSLVLIGGAYALDFRQGGEVPRWWKSGCYTLALGVSGGSWLLLADFASWSLWSVSALGLTAISYFLFALFHRRNVLSYIATVTLAIALFSAVTVYLPLLEFRFYRWLALGISLCFLGLGYSVQRRFQVQWQDDDAAQGQSEGTTRQSFWRRDIFRPFELQRRYDSDLPYLICEPLYNVALLLTSSAWLFNIQDGFFALFCLPVYLAIFALYPSRIWIYFIIFSASDGFLELILEAVPERYHSWPLVFFSLAWMLMGQLLEAFFRARDRTQTLSCIEQERKLIQPFFQAALFFNLCVLRYFFGDMQQLFTPEGWIMAREEALPLVLTSSLYILRLRESVSKLWLYPGLLTATLGLFFGLSPWVGIEGRLPLLCALALLMLLLAEFLNHWPGFCLWLQEMRLEQAERWNADEARFERFARVHLDDFFSPFYSFASVLAGVCAAVSLLLFHPLATAFNRLHDFGMQGHEDVVYLAQIFAWLLLTLFWRRMYQMRQGQLALHLSQWHALMTLLWLGEHWLMQPVGAVYLLGLSLVLLAIAVRLSALSGWPPSFLLALRYQRHALALLALFQALFLNGSPLHLKPETLGMIYLATVGYLLLHLKYDFHRSQLYLLSAWGALGSALGMYKFWPLHSFWSVPAVWWGLQLGLEYLQKLRPYARHSSTFQRQDLARISQAFGVGAGLLLMLSALFFIRDAMHTEPLYLPAHSILIALAALVSGPGMLLLALVIWRRALRLAAKWPLYASVLCLLLLESGQLLHYNAGMSVYAAGLGLLFWSSRRDRALLSEGHPRPDGLRLTALSQLGLGVCALGAYQGEAWLFAALLLTALVLFVTEQEALPLWACGTLSLIAAVCVLAFEALDSWTGVYVQESLSNAQLCLRLALCSALALYQAYVRQSALGARAALCLSAVCLLFLGAWHPFWALLGVSAAHLLHHQTRFLKTMRGRFDFMLSEMRQWGVILPCLLFPVLGFQMLEFHPSFYPREDAEALFIGLNLLAQLIAVAGYWRPLDPEIAHPQRYAFLSLLGANFTWSLGLLPFLNFVWEGGTWGWTLLCHSVCWFAALSLWVWLAHCIQRRVSYNLGCLVVLILLCLAPLMSADAFFEQLSVLDFAQSPYALEWLFLAVALSFSSLLLQRQMPVIMGALIVLLPLGTLSLELLQGAWWVHWLLLMLPGLGLLSLALLHMRLKTFWQRYLQSPVELGWRIFARWA